MTAPLQGIRVVDLSTVFSGPIAAALLSDQGGDTTRQIGPAKGDRSASFIAANRGKRNLAINLKASAARAVVHALLAKADVLIEKFRPGVMQRLGLDDDDLALRFPQLIRLSITRLRRRRPARCRQGLRRGDPGNWRRGWVSTAPRCCAS